MLKIYLNKKKLEQSSQAFLSQHKKYADYSKKLVGLFPKKYVIDQQQKGRIFSSPSLVRI